LIAKMLKFPSLPFFDFILAIAIAQIVSLIPIAPGGFGIGEVAFANVMTLLNANITGPYATIFLAYRIINILPYLPGIMLFSFDKNLLKKKMASACGNQLAQPE
jgi:uncharacterized membrane protein YbhN (UPF0104 family)